MAKKREIKLSAYLVGTGMHIGSWRHPDAKADASIDIDYYKKLVQIAERGKFDIAFIADSLAINEDSHPNILTRFEPTTLQAHLAGVTSKIGLVATASTTYSEPYNLARTFASLDHISKGRAGWNVVTTGDLTGATALNFGKTEHLDHAARYERAEEFLDVVLGLWDSWEDDAFVRDKASGVFFDPSKLHRVQYEGKFFSVQGPLNISRSKQGHPVIVQAGSSESGQQLGARTAEVVFSHKKNIDAAKEFYKSLKQKAASFGRSSDELVILQGITPIIGETEELAHQKHQQLQELADPQAALNFIAGYLGLSGADLVGYSLDTPVVDISLPDVNGMKSVSEQWRQIIEEENLTIGQLYARFEGTDKFIGTPVQVADELERWFSEEAADGFMVVTSFLPDGLEDFVNHVIPILQERGLFRLEYEGDTLREHLGLAVPVNRYVHAKSVQI